jgi:glycyl-tRNA synthetase
LVQVLSLPPLVAPTKVLIVPLSAREEFDPLVREVCACRFPSLPRSHPPSTFPILALTSSAASKLRKAGVFSRVDDSNTSIGKRYARNDELGTPFGVTLDFACASFTAPRDVSLNASFPRMSL